MLGPAMPALFTSTSILPRLASVFLSASPIETSSATSTLSAPARSQTATLAPEASSRFTMAAPMPVTPPVTTAVRPLRSRLFMSFLYRACHAGHVVLHEERIQHRHRQRAEQRP